VHPENPLPDRDIETGWTRRRPERTNPQDDKVSWFLNKELIRISGPMPGRLGSLVCRQAVWASLEAS
jgi:hypothetical protein